MASKPKVVPKVVGKLSDTAILAKMKTDAPWLYATYTSPTFTADQQKVFMGWARAAASGAPVTSQQMAAQTYNWPITQLWNANQQKMFQDSFNHPGQYKSDLAAAQTGVDQLIKVKGLTVDPATRDKAINRVLLQGMPLDDPRVIQLLTNTYQYPTDPNAVPVSGESSTAVGDVNNIFAEYGIPVPKDPAQMTDFVKGIIGPNGTTQSVTDYAKKQSANLYPWMSGAIDAGITPKAYLSPIITNVANTLGINPNTVDITNPKWSNLFTTVDKTGVRLPSSYGQIDQMIKTDPQYGYDYSPEGRKQGADFASNIKSEFGY